MTQIFIASLTLVVLIMTGCGGGGGGGGSAANSSQSSPTITIQPVSASVYENASATFNVVATGSGSLSYQWKLNGSAIAGATSNSYITPAVSLTNNNSIYSVDVTGVGGVTTSSNATLTVIQLAPAIVTAPNAQSVVAGQALQLSVTATGAPTLSYQWYKNGSLITGATLSAYSTIVTLSDSGSNFYVKISNSNGSTTSSPTTLVVIQSQLTDLVISEVSTCYYYNTDCWFELYNPTLSSINVSNYTVRASSFDLSSNRSALASFTIPSGISIPADGYIILSGNNANASQIGNQNIKLRSGSLIPSWSANGFIELLKNNATVDYVSFGNNSTAPTTAGSWSGANVAALLSSATDYGKSIVRPYPRNTDTNSKSAADWIATDWVTPGGKNDVPAGVLDSDGDGIPDSAEVSGGTFGGIDLYSMGARTNQIDLFIEIDQMNSTDAGVILRKESLQKMADLFATKSIFIHIDAGNAFNSSFSVADFNLGQGSNIVPFEKCVSLSTTVCTQNTSFRKTVYDWKYENMDLRRLYIFHYALFGFTQNANGTYGNSGLAELVGNDLIVTLGDLGLNTNTTLDTNTVINYQAATLMHELGHNMGLRHGGFEDLNYKPNYWSVMNYTYVNSGLDPDPKSATAYLRWRHKDGDGTPTLCNLVASPCGAPNQFIINYSDGSSSVLHESALLESGNIGRGANPGAYADWNLDGSLTTTPVMIDLNQDGSYTTLADYNDWANLIFPFVRNTSAASGINIKKAGSNVLLNPIGNDIQPFATESFNMRP
jgi:hypothetical protein